MSVPVCKDCKFYLFNERGHWCTAEQATDFNVVTGNYDTVGIELCYNMRNGGSCGFSAIYYQPRETK